jgi:hypothetical protein
MQFSSVSVGSTYDFAVATDGRDNIDLSLLDLGQLGQLQQSPGIDAIVLQGGDDTALDTGESRYFFGNAGNDSINLSGGNDLASGGRDTDTLTGGDGNDSLFGNLGNDVLSGDAGDDLILGGQGEDRISGGAGNDYLGGDKGNDTLTGGDGADTFVLQAGFGVDTVTDFDVARDKFVLPVAVKFETLTFEEISATETEIAIKGASSPLVVVLNVGSQDLQKSLFIEPPVTPGDTIETAFDLGVVEGLRQVNGFVGALDLYDFFEFSVQEYTSLSVEERLERIYGGGVSAIVFGDVNRDGQQSFIGGPLSEDYIAYVSSQFDVDLPPGEYTLMFFNQYSSEAIYSGSWRCWIELGQRLAKWNRYIIPAQVVNQ